MVKIQEHAVISIRDFPLCPLWSIPSFHSANFSKLHFRAHLRAADTTDNPASQHAHCGWDFYKYTHWGWSLRLPIIILIKSFNIHVRVFLAQPTSPLAHLDRNKNSNSTEEGTTGHHPGGVRDTWATVVGVGVQEGKDRKENTCVSLSEQGAFLLQDQRAQSPHTSTWCAHPWIGNLQPYSTRVPHLTSCFWKIALGCKKSAYFYNIF